MDDPAEEAGRLATGLLQAHLAEDPEAFDVIANSFLDREKMVLFIAAAMFAAWIIELIGIAEPGTVVLYAVDEATGARPHEVIGAAIVQAVVDDKVDDFVETFMSAPEEDAFASAMYLCGEAARMIREGAQAAMN